MIRVSSILTLLNRSKFSEKYFDFSNYHDKYSVVTIIQIHLEKISITINL